MRHFYIAANGLITRLETAEGLTDPKRGVRLQLLGKTTGLVDRRRFSYARVSIADGVDYIMTNRNMVEFSALVEDMQSRFSREFYTKVRKAYRGTGIPVTPPLKSSTLKMRRKRGISRTAPYYETGKFLNNGIKHDTETHTVYLSRASHPPRPGDGASSITYAQIYFINEYGRPDWSIPARPVWRPTARAILARYERELYRAIQKYIV